MGKKISELGKPYGRGVVIAEAGRAKNRQVLWQLRCECGNLYVTTGRSLRNGLTRSCGCLQREEAAARLTKHGHARIGKTTPEYRVWYAMNERSHNPHCDGFKTHGSKGVIVCLEWRAKSYGGDEGGFERFLAYLMATIGPHPGAPLSIDRWPKREGNYEPGNIRWATKAQQRENQRPHSRRRVRRPPGYWES